MRMIAVSVRCASGTVGFLKMGTPLLTASTPVIAVHPLANARTMIHAPTASVGAAAAGGATTAAGCPPLATTRATPTATVIPSVTTKCTSGA